MFVRLILIGVCLLGHAFPATCLSGDEQEHEDAADLAYQGITDLLLLRDDVLQRYALMMTGERHRFADASEKEREPLRIIRLYRLQAAMKKSSFSYSASGLVMDADRSSMAYEYQRWTELYKCGLSMKGRSGRASGNGYQSREKGESVNRFMEENLLTSVAYDPFDDLVLHAMHQSSPMDQYGWIEKIYFQQSKLLSADFVSQGNVRSRWLWTYHLGEFEIELTQSKAIGFLPVHVKYTSKSGAHPNLSGETEIEWSKHAATGKFLPRVIKTASGGLFNSQSLDRHYWVFEWKLGKEISDDFFDCESEDFRLKFSPLFDFYFDTYARPGGYRTGTPWKTPDVLLQKGAVGD